LLAGEDPVNLVLQFNPLLTGKAITVNPSPEIKFQPGDGIVAVGASGGLAFRLQMRATAVNGRILFYVDGVPLELRVARVPLSMVIARETSAAEAGR